MKTILTIAAVLAFNAALARADDGAIKTPPVAHPQQVTEATEATTGSQCSAMTVDPCQQLGVTGSDRCVDEQWTCVTGCPMPPPSIPAGSCNGGTMQCVDGQWQCQAQAQTTCSGTPQCGLVLTPVCVQGSWECWVPNIGTGQGSGGTGSNGSTSFVPGATDPTGAGAAPAPVASGPGTSFTPNGQAAPQGAAPASNSGAATAPAPSQQSSGQGAARTGTSGN